MLIYNPEVSVKATPNPDTGVDPESAESSSRYINNMLTTLCTAILYLMASVVTNKVFFFD
jgi:hypothetical protein